VCLAAVTIAALAGVPANAAAARRSVPQNFFGVVVPPLMVGQSGAALDQQLGLMASSGVEAVRISIAWGQLEPVRGQFDFGELDSLVGAVAKHHLHAVVNVAYTPAWASTRPNDPQNVRFPPRNVGDFAVLMHQLVTRYGPGGAFFAGNPALPRDPVREWQLWNEEDAPWYWNDKRWWRGYTQLLKASYPAIHRVDRGAEVVAGSLVASSYSESPWVALTQLYRAGAKRYFDSVSVHPFTDATSTVALSMNHLVTIVQRMRAVMHRFHDARKPLIITEMQWSAAAGKIPAAADLGFETTATGQARRLAAAYKLLARRRKSLGVTQVYWSTWATDYQALGDTSDMTFRFTGLVRYDYNNGVFTPMPVLRTYAATAAALEGCRKGPTAACR
jgi:hypothetical protein